MRRLTLLPLLILPLLAAAQEERPAWSLPIEEVPVVTRRTMKEIGVQRTQLDSTVLHDNISLSMADVLTQNANLFIKSYGRATLATAEFRGTSPSHTQVTWNGMRINSPMLGTVDFSMIPAFFIDAATLLHGASSIGVTGGALGGAVVLGTRPSAQRGWQTQYVQGVGSFSTFDQYLRVSYGGQRWSASTRAVYSTSDNDFRYTNYDKMELVYGPDGAVVDTYHPVERNRSGYFRDLHLLQELYYNRGDGTRYGLSAWYLRSKRGLPFLSTDYRDDVTILNEQREQTLRAVASWERLRERLKLGAKLGYTYTASAYDFRQRNAQGAQSDLTLSRSYLHTPYGQFEAEYYVGRRWLFTGNVALHVPMVDCSDKSPYHEGDVYDRYRVELSGHLSAKWRPTERIGLAVNLRGELYDRHAVPLIPAFFFDWVVSERGNVVLKASVARNYATRRSTTATTSRAATPTCAPNTASPTTAAYRSHWAAKRRATRCGARRRSSTRTSTTGFSGCRRGAATGRPATSAKSTTTAPRRRSTPRCASRPTGGSASTPTSHGPPRSTTANRSTTPTPPTANSWSTSPNTPRPPRRRWAGAAGRSSTNGTITANAIPPRATTRRSAPAGSNPTT